MRFLRKTEIRKRVQHLIHQVPALESIFLSADSLEIKRKKIKKFLSDMLIATFDDNPTVPPLEWVLASDAIGVFRNILSARSERLTGFSFLKYIDAILNGRDTTELPTSGSGFFAERIVVAE